ncbi:MAG: ABC transporter ATP-binding protein [Phycisphaerae bacterium]|nr:ABC transporter ATP-binding protein [Tepidisphaeraceae bacterium]
MPPDPRAASPTCSPTPRGAGLYRRILAYFRPDLRLILLLIGLIWVSLLAGVLEGAAVGTLTDTLLSPAPRNDWLTRTILAPLGPSRPARLVWLALLWLAVRATNDVVTLFREMINHRLRLAGTARVRTELFDHLQSLSPAYHKSRPQGDAIYRLSTDSLGFFGVLDTFIGAANSALTVLVIGAVMAGFNVTITVVCLCLTPLLVLANAWFVRTIRRTTDQSKRADTDFTTFVQRALATVSLAQLFGRQRTESARFRDAVDTTVRAGMRMSWQVQLYPMTQRLIYALGHAFVLGYGGWLVYRSQFGAAPVDQATVAGINSPGTAPAPFTVGGITAMLVYLGQLWEPVRRMAGFTADVQANVAACARVFAVLDLTPTVADQPGATSLPVRPRTLELRGVQFAYGPGAPPVLKAISATIEPGRMVAFVGPSGSGKSTLLSLLPRFYDPTAGAVLLDGHDLRGVRLADVRGHIALVPQDSPVIAGTIAENVAFGRPDATPEQVRRAAELAGAGTFINELPAEYDTPVTEGGQNLSGGQRQRLAIARALLTDAPVLVLDEPTSGLDPHHERLVLATLHSLRDRHTVILVTHSLSAVTECDAIYVLSGGRVVEAGTHDELIARGGTYADMAGGIDAAVPRTPRHSAA